MLLTLLKGGTAAPPATTLWLRVGGVWKAGTLWLKVAGVWKQGTLFYKVGGIWK